MSSVPKVHVHVHVHCALLLAHRYLSALTKYFLNVGIYSIILG